MFLFTNRKIVLWWSNCIRYTTIRLYSKVPFFQFYEELTGETIENSYLPILKKKHPHIDTLSHERIQCSLQILKKFNISPEDACRDIHIFSMNPITVDNYGNILKECGFIQIVPKHLIRYHTLVRKRTIRQLKKEGLIDESLNLHERIKNEFTNNLMELKSVVNNYDESQTSILQIRMAFLEAYLKCKLQITADEFEKYCRLYLPLKHKPMADIMEAIDIAQKDLNFDNEGIRRNGFLLSADPINTKLILENIKTLAGINIADAIRNEPAILKNNYNSLLEIRDILEQHMIPLEAQRRCMRVFCMCPRSVRERLAELRNMTEYQVLLSNPRVLSLVVHKKKMVARLNKIQLANKQCFSLNHLVASNNVFNSYIKGFGNKICGRDVAILVCHSLAKDPSQGSVRAVHRQLKRHKFYLHCALNVVHENIKYLQKHFCNTEILNNCQLLLYPLSEIEQYLSTLMEMRNSDKTTETSLDVNYNNVNCSCLTDEQILSLTLYEIEKKFHFTGDGVWSKSDINRMETCVGS